MLAVSNPGDLRFRPRVVGVVDVLKNLLSLDGNLHSPGEAGSQFYRDDQLSTTVGSMSPSQLATSQLGWGYHTARSGIDPGDLQFHPRVVGVVDIWKEF